MAHLPTLPDPSEHKDLHGQTGTFQASNSKFSFQELTRLLGRHGAGSSSEDLALDLVLHEIVSQACSATNAAGAAIALSHNGKFVCRATTGNHAPDLGSHLAMNSGLSGACIQSCEIQRCDDTETDTRVDEVACRRLGVRSVTVVPMLRESELVGILEVFSPRPFDFTDHDAQTLRALCQRTMDTMVNPAEKQEIALPTVAFDGNTIPVPRKDPWILVLTVLIVALALLLGWMVGHRGWNKTVKEDKTPATTVSAQPTALPANDTSSPTVLTPLTANGNSVPVAANPKAPVATPGGLVVYEQGKLVFQEKPAPGSAHNVPVQVPPSAVESLVIERVEPRYPEQARLAQIQGAVVLQVDVTVQGTVQELRTISGDPQLASAAAEAVRQWRFRPYAPRGHALSFQTQVTVDFKLP